MRTADDDQCVLEAIEALRRNRGDQAAWENIYDVLVPYVTAVAFRLTRGRKDLSDDIVQEGFLRLLRYADFEKFDSSHALTAYLTRVVQNVYMDQKRHTSRETNYSDGDVMEPAAPERAEDRAILEQIEDQLKDEEKYLAQLLGEGLPLQQIADKLGISYTNAGVRVHRLRTQMHKIMNNK